MTAPSPSNSKDAAGAVPPVVEPGAHRPGSTRATVKGETAPRLPHERDESADSGTREPDEIMEKAADDMNKGAVDRVRGPATQKHYSNLASKSAADAKSQKP
jgi:hypothetical protein